MTTALPVTPAVRFHLSQPEAPLVWQSAWKSPPCGPSMKRNALIARWPSRPVALPEKEPMVWLMPPKTSLSSVRTNVWK